MPKHIPMLFKTHLVELMIEGVKLETRRVLRPQLPPVVGGVQDDGDLIRSLNGHDGSVVGVLKRKARSGDLIWAREKHYAFGKFVETSVPTSKTGKPKEEFHRSRDVPVMFNADSIDVAAHSERHKLGWHVRPSLFLEKADSRATAIVSHYWVERLRDMTERSAFAEGVQRRAPPVPASWRYRIFDGEAWHTAPTVAGAFGAMWDVLNPNALAASNPWVECYRFEVKRANILDVARART